MQSKEERLAILLTFAILLGIVTLALLVI